MTKSFIKIASWNIEGRLSMQKQGRGSYDQILNNISRIDADIIFLPEAYTEESIDKLQCLNNIKRMGYAVYSAPYDDDLANRKDAYTKHLSMLLLSKTPLSDFKYIKLGNFRNCISAIYKNDKDNIRIFGIHLDDRLESTRLNQITDLSSIINQSKEPTIVIGDFNAMHGDDFWPSKFLKTKFSKIISNIILPKLYKRVIEMANGSVIKYLENNTHLTDTDIKHRPTTTPKIRNYEFLPSIKLIQIDHIFTSNNINASEYTIHKDGGSDHRAISAQISIKEI